MIDHITFQVPMFRIGDGDLTEFFKLIGFEEIAPEEAVPKGWRVRWFDGGVATDPAIHVVATEEGRWPVRDIGLAHLAVRVGAGRYVTCAASDFCVRDSPESNRCWLEFAANAIRVEVRP
jgi:hypothetical protein